jgi:hypothetical protein
VFLHFGLPALLSKRVDGLQQVWEAASWHEAAREAGVGCAGGGVADAARGAADGHR